MVKRDNSEIGIILLAILVGSILIAYFLSKILLTLGFLLIFISIFLIIIGISQDNNLAFFGIILLLIGVIIAGVGHTGVTFFEQNPTGKNLLDAANTAVNTTKGTVETYGEIGKIRRFCLDHKTEDGQRQTQDLQS